MMTPITLSNHPNVTPISDGAQLVILCGEVFVGKFCGELLRV